MSISAGIRSLAIALPPTARTNDYYRKRYPELVAKTEEGSLQRLFARAGAAPTDLFTEELTPYLSDPFRGTVERRVLPETGTALSLELEAARKALDALGMDPSRVDLILSASFLPDQIGVGNAVFIAQALGIHAAAWNIETACTSAIAALTNACALVQAGQFDNVLVVISCTYSRAADDADSLSWFFGDGAAAYVVSRVPDGEGLLGSKSIATVETCSAFRFEEGVNRPADRRFVVRSSARAGTIVRENAMAYIRECCEGAASRAGIRLKDVDFLVCGTQTPWMHSFAARALEIDPARTINLYAEVANIGAAMVPVNLHTAASRGLIKPGDLVLLYNFGGVSTAAAAVVKWGQTALGPPMDPPRERIV